MWELHDGTEQVGPLDEEHVLRMIRDGLPPNTLVRPVGKDAWKGLRAHAPFAMAIETRDAGGDASASPSFSAPALAPAVAPPLQARKKPKSDFIGAGCVVQGFGLLAPVAGFFLGGPIGAMVGLVGLLVLFIIGARMAQYFICGGCGNRLADEAKVCPTCRAELVR
jgi:ribosomal protein L40E